MHEDMLMSFLSLGAWMFMLDQWVIVCSLDLVECGISLFVGMCFGFQLV